MKRTTIPDLLEQQRGKGERQEEEGREGGRNNTSQALSRLYVLGSSGQAELVTKERTNGRPVGRRKEENG